MKSSKPKTLSQSIRRALKKQVQEYADRYHPQMGEVSVAINPTGTVASIRSDSKQKGSRITKKGDHRSRWVKE